MRQDDAIQYIVEALGGKGSGKDQCRGFGYDLYLPHLMRAFATQEGCAREGIELRARELSEHFLAAAWDLCRRGIIRPGVRRFNEQSTQDGSAGAGYSVTPFGKQWLSEHDDLFVPTEPGRFAELLAGYKQRFGPGFHERGQEAIRCYGAHTYLACCAMCGAAAESILLALAIARRGDASEVLRVYSSANGRSRVEAMILGQARQRTQTTVSAYLDILKYWRDESAHGQSSEIKDVEAHTSLALMLRFAQFAHDHWEELTGQLLVDPPLRNIPMRSRSRREERPRDAD